jgi:hypothetical protein
MFIDQIGERGLEARAASEEAVRVADIVWQRHRRANRCSMPPG